MSSADDVAKIIALNAAAGGSAETAPAPPAEIEEGGASEEAVRTQAMQVPRYIRDAGVSEHVVRAPATAVLRSSRDMYMSSCSIERLATLAL